MEKVCTKCKKNRPATNQHFHKGGGEYGLTYWCKDCVREYTKQYRHKNKDKLSKDRATWRNKNKEHKANYQKEYERDNREHRRTYLRGYFKKRYSNDINFKLSLLLRSRARAAIKNNTKNIGTIDLLGCSVEHARNHLESQFADGMTWDNLATKGWHIDHIQPCSAFDLTDSEQQKVCFHYTNLQPLWSEENWKKGASINQ